MHLKEFEAHVEDMLTGLVKIRKEFFKDSFDARQAIESKLKPTEKLICLVPVFRDE